MTNYLSLSIVLGFTRGKYGLYKIKVFPTILKCSKGVFTFPKLSL